MPILDIINRTENWKTAVYFSPLFNGNSARLAERLGEFPKPQSEDVKLELFWRGMRDFLNITGVKKEFARQDYADLYVRLFPDLRRSIEEFGEFHKLQPDNYDVSNDDRRVNLANNLANTEIDVVLETPNHIFIGEAKHKMTFGANGDLVLVHQLIRQYVMAKTLIEFSNKRKAVIPFVVCDNVDAVMKTSQVHFMIEQGWLNAENVLDWKEIKKISP